MRRNRGRKARRLVSSGPRYVLLVGLAAIYVMPFIWMVGTSLKSQAEIYAHPTAILPKVWVFANYAEVFRTIPYLRYMLNTLLIACSCVFGYVLTASMVAYSMAKIDWVGRKWLFPIIIGTMMIPSQVTMIPVYIVFHRLRLIGSYVPLILPAFFGGPYYIFLLRQFFRTIPDSLTDAARIDGAGEARIYAFIMTPLCVPALISIGIFAFLYAWGDFFHPLLYLNKQIRYTISLGLQAFLLEHSVEWNLLMAASTLFTVPMIVLFFFSQRSFIEGIAVTGIKG